MGHNAQQILEAALKLPEADRASLAEQLLESLSPEASDVSDEQFAAELDRRRTEVEQGIARPIPWSQVDLED